MEKITSYLRITGDNTVVTVKNIEHIEGKVINFSEDFFLTSTLGKGKDTPLQKVQNVKKGLNML